MHSQSEEKIVGHDDFLSWIVKAFLQSRLSLVLILLSVLVGLAALYLTPREEDPQIVVPLADIFVRYPGHTASEVEQHVSSKLERLLYQIDGVEYVYSMSRDDSAVITVRFYVGQDREDSLVKVFKKINENMDVVPAGVQGWVVKSVEIDDVPIVSFAISSNESSTAILRRLGEEMGERLSQVSNVSRVQVIGGEPRQVQVEILPERLAAYQLAPLNLVQALQASNLTIPAGALTHDNRQFQVEAGKGLVHADELHHLLVGVADGRPIFLRDVARVTDASAEAASYTRHGWGPARNWVEHPTSAGAIVGTMQTNPPGHGIEADTSSSAPDIGESQGSVTIAIAKQKGSNAVQVASHVIEAATKLKQQMLPDDVEFVVLRNYGLTANEKVNELISALGIAILIVVLLLTLSMGWREAMVVALAVPVVFGLTLAVNLLFGYTVNRVTLFALILSLGLLVDDPIVDVENIARHFHQRGYASLQIVMDAVAEIRPPLISATLAVIVSFLPMFFITGMMGPYMSPMALNVPVAMLMSMVVAFTITPWLTYQVLKGGYGTTPPNDPTKGSGHSGAATSAIHELYDPVVLQRSPLYKFFRPIMLPLLKTRLRAVGFLLLILGLTGAAASMAMLRMVPLKMLPFDNKNEILLLIDMDEGTALEQTDELMRELEAYIARQPTVTDYASYVGLSGPIDFNGMVRHYYLRQGSHLAEMRVNFVGKLHRSVQSHGLALEMRKELNAIAERFGALLRIVELPPGPPVLASLVAEVYGQPSLSYEALQDAGTTVAARMAREPGVAEVDDQREAPAPKWTFVVDKEKAAISGISTDAIAKSLQIALGGDTSQSLRLPGERNPLGIQIRLPKALRSHPEQLEMLRVQGGSGQVIPITEIGRWEPGRVSQTIYHKNLRRVVYVNAETVGRPPAECVLDMLADLQPWAGVPSDARMEGNGWVSQKEPRPVAGRTYFTNGSGIAWSLPKEVDIVFAGEGEWKITIDVFRDLGLAFGAAMLMIYVILVAQTGSFLIPVVVMLAIPLTVLGVMPGFWLLNQVAGGSVDGFADPVYFTATAMIGMIALAGIVTRDSIILVDFIDQTVRAGRPMIDAILESRVVRLRPILLTAGAAMLSSLPITLDPIFSGLGWSLIFGLFASTLFTLFVIPLTYWLFHPAGQAAMTPNNSVANHEST